MTLIVMAAVWKQISYNFLFFLAGLQSHPQEPDRGRGHRRRGPLAALLDGRQFPLLSPTTFFLLVINIVYAFFDTFAIVDAATEGGPGKDTAILVYKVYFDGFKALDLGGSAAQSVVLMVIVVALTVMQFRYVEKKVQLLMTPEPGRANPWSKPPPPSRTWCCVLGVIVVAFPLYMTFVASTHTAEEIVQQVPMPLLPGATAGELPPRCSAAARHRRQLTAAGGADDVGQPGQALVIAVGKIAISLLSAFAVVYFRFPLRGLVFWMIFVTLMLPVEVRILPTYKVVSRPGHAQQLRRPDGAADRLGHRHLPVPPVLPDRARRTGRGRAHRRRRADALLQGRAAAAVATSIAALFVIQFIYGWNQYLWPLLVTTTRTCTRW
jgi:hypothetical protein